MAAQGRDIKLSAQRVEGYRNFATKLWNAARFAEMNGCVTVPGFDPRNAKETLNRWIAHETAKAAREVTEAIEAYKFNDAANAAYRFVWNIYCDWYLELAKPVLTGADGPAKDETRAMVAWARDEIVKLLHPFMPFITEELWWVTGPTSVEPERAPKLTDEEIAQERPDMLALTPGRRMTGLDDDKAEAEIGWVVDLITAIRSLRAEMNIPPATLMPLVLSGASKETQGRATRWLEFVKRLARVSEVVFGDRVPEGAVQFLVRGEVAALPLKGVIDLAAETRAPAEGTGQGRIRHPARRPEAEQSEIRRQCRRRSGRGREGETRRGRRPPRQNPGGAGTAEGRGLGDALCRRAASRSASRRRSAFSSFLPSSPRGRAMQSCGRRLRARRQPKSSSSATAITPASRCRPRSSQPRRRAKAHAR